MYSYRRALCALLFAAALLVGCDTTAAPVAPTPGGNPSSTAVVMPSSAPAETAAPAAPGAGTPGSYPAPAAGTPSGYPAPATGPSAYPAPTAQP